MDITCEELGLPPTATVDQLIEAVMAIEATEIQILRQHYCTIRDSEKGFALLEPTYLLADAKAGFLGKFAGKKVWCKDLRLEWRKINSVYEELFEGRNSLGRVEEISAVDPQLGWRPWRATVFGGPWKDKDTREEAKVWAENQVSDLALRIVQAVGEALGADERAVTSQAKIAVEAVRGILRDQ